MKSTYDRHAKAGTLQLHLLKYDNKYHQDQRQPQDQISVPSLKFQNAPEVRKISSNSRLSNKHQSVQDQKNIASSIQDEEELLAMCINLTSRVEGLKQQKYQQAIQQYEQSKRQKIEQLLDKQKKKISQKYAAVRKQLTASYEQQKTKLSKACEQIAKFKAAYTSILDQLTQRRAKINKQYEQSVLKVKEHKDRLIAQWKRNSNEQIIKVTPKPT